MTMRDEPQWKRDLAERKLYEEWLRSERDKEPTPWHAWQAALATRAQAGGGWQPIETAPKDGRDILLAYLPDDLGKGWPPVVICYWSKSVEGWVFQNRAARSYSATPVGWRPLPPHQSQQAGEKKGE